MFTGGYRIDARGSFKFAGGYRIDARGSFKFAGGSRINARCQKTPILGLFIYSGGIFRF